MVDELVRPGQTAFATFFALLVGSKIWGDDPPAAAEDPGYVPNVRDPGFWQEEAAGINWCQILASAAVDSRLWGAEDLGVDAIEAACGRLLEDELFVTVMRIVLLLGICLFVVLVLVDHGDQHFGWDLGFPAAVLEYLGLALVSAIAGPRAFIAVHTAYAIGQDRFVFAAVGLIVLFVQSLFF